MAVAVKVPSVGESVTEGVLAQWLKKDGDFVEEGEPIAELETEKATQELPAPAAGILHIKVNEGETVAVGDEVGAIDPKGKAEAKEKPREEKAAKKEKADKDGEEKRKEQPTPTKREEARESSDRKKEKAAAPEAVEEHGARVAEHCAVRRLGHP